MPALKAGNDRRGARRGVAAAAGRDAGPAAFPDIATTCALTLAGTGTGGHAACPGSTCRPWRRPSRNDQRRTADRDDGSRGHGAEHPNAAAPWDSGDDRPAAGPSGPGGNLRPLRGQDWPALRETLEVLAKADPSGTRTLANAILPQANGRLAATLLAFTGAVKKGDARAWLGAKAAKALEKLGRTDLLEKLEDDFKQLARQAAEVPPGDWKPYSIPFSDGTELHRILMHVRQPGAEEVDEDASGADGHGSRANRFLIDLTLSRIGELQLDGLIRPRRFDLILRTHMPLPPEMRQEIGKLVQRLAGNAGNDRRGLVPGGDAGLGRDPARPVRPRRHERLKRPSEAVTVPGGA